MAELAYRSRLLGADRFVCNLYGGNTSMKTVEQDHLGRDVEVLWVKGSGSDLSDITERGFADLKPDEVLPLFERDAMSDDQMVAYLERSTFEPGRLRQSIETLCTPLCRPNMSTISIPMRSSRWPAPTTASTILAAAGSIPLKTKHRGGLVKEGDITMTATAPITTPEDLSEATVQAYRQQGFVHVPGVIAQAEVAEFYAAALALSKRMQSLHRGAVFTQLVNVWREDAALKRLTLHPNVGRIAEKLAGVPLRLWHDQILIKQPHNNAATEFHQDQPYWPHANSRHPISAWIALCDVPVERGCMTFIPGSHRRTDLPMQNLQDKTSLFGICPDLAWEPRVTLPLKAGDCTFHHGRTAHMATPNFTGDPRVAHVVIFVDAATIYAKRPHVVTDPLNLQDGQPLEGEMFPTVASFGTTTDE